MLCITKLARLCVFVCVCVCVWVCVGVCVFVRLRCNVLIQLLCNEMKIIVIKAFWAMRGVQCVDCTEHTKAQF